MSYPPQFPQQPYGAPQQFQQQPQQPYQQFAPPQAYAPPQPPPPNGSLSDYFSQPSGGGGPALKFNQKPIGTSYAGIVSRAITDADVRAQSNPQTGQVTTFRDGRPKFVMVVPLQVPATQEHPDGVATWWVKGQARDELVRAMAEAGAPEGPPEAGAAIRVTLVGQRPIQGFNQPQLQYRVEYARPQGAAAVDVTQAAPIPSSPPAQVQQAPVVQAEFPVQQQAPAQPQVQQAPAQQPQVPQVPQATTPEPNGLDEAQQALLAKLLQQNQQ